MTMQYMKPEKAHFLGQYKGEKKKQVRATILMSMGKRKEQIAFFEKHLIQPQREVNKIGDKVLRNELPIEFYIREGERLTKFMQEFLGACPKGESK